MNWVWLAVSLTCVSRGSVGAPAYAPYDLPQRQSVGGYQGPPVVPVILPGGFIADTEEVARAKDLHFSAYAQVAGKAQAYSPSAEYSQPKYTHAAPVSRPVYSQPKYTQVAAPVYTQAPQQPVRQQDYNVPQHQYSGSSRAAGPVYQTQQPYQPLQKYQGPPVIPVVLPSGYIAETADVEAAKQHHFQLVAQAQAAVARAQERDAKKYGSAAYSRRDYDEDDGSRYDDSDQDYNQVYRAAPQSVGYTTPQSRAYTAPQSEVYAAPQRSLTRQQYQGPPAVPVVLPSGHIADTAEVAAAKISHLQQLLDAAQKSLPQQRYH